MDEIKRVLEIAEIIPFRYMVQHLGGPQRRIRRAQSGRGIHFPGGTHRLRAAAWSRILLENIPNGSRLRARLKMFLEMTHLDLNFCFDTGHANIMESVETRVQLMKTRIRSTHIHDNDGKEDKHLFPFVAEGGTIDWPQTVGLLASRPEQYPLLLELKEQPGLEHPLQAVQQIFERLDALTVAEPVR